LAVVGGDHQEGVFFKEVEVLQLLALLHLVGLLHILFIVNQIVPLFKEKKIRSRPTLNCGFSFI
jgi:hypothetical protein